ncbi:MAG: hypothetical protein FJ276_16420, partial [Planctomycetes bacterium]|nr:hypothetical protein [Planctomycetota bacterium]
MGQCFNRATGSLIPVAGQHAVREGVSAGVARVLLPHPIAIPTETSFDREKTSHAGDFRPAVSLRVAQQWLAGARRSRLQQLARQLRHLGAYRNLPHLLGLRGIHAPHHAPRRLFDVFGRYACQFAERTQSRVNRHEQEIAKRLVGGVVNRLFFATHPVCSPSRAGLMSGMYQHRFGFEHNSGPERYASPEFGMPREVPSLAEKLKAAGYATGMVGKWHIGFTEGLRPHERGFDYYYGFLSGAR